MEAVYLETPDRRAVSFHGGNSQHDFQPKFFLNLYHFPQAGDENNRAEPNDSPWAVIGGVMKYFRMSYEEVVFNRSYINILLLNKSIPSFKTDGEKTKGGTKKIKADKPMHANQFFGMFAKRIEK